MRRLVALMLSVFFLVGSVLPPVSAEHLSGLVEHYHEHQLEEGGDLNVLTFLWEHYAADAFHRKHPNHSHSHLPAVDFHAASGLFVSLLTTFRFTPLLPEGAASQLPSWENHYTFRFAAALLNPPKRG
ncbi:MAG: hypothetical protein LH606_02205 [Cytophagaceae bacterium]|nr:hypothetical protein [Cytophagaceae bacterium]